MTVYIYDKKTGKVIPKPPPDRSATSAYVSCRDFYFVSHQLPRWSPAKYHTKEGKPVFTSKSQANETAKRIEGSSDIICQYGEL
jgi:hypothetical protein